MSTTAGKLRLPILVLRKIDSQAQVYYYSALKFQIATCLESIVVENLLRNVCRRHWRTASHSCKKTLDCIFGIYRNFSCCRCVT